MNQNTIEKIVRGIDRFHVEKAPTLIDDLRRLVNDGQQPAAMLVTCSDSRMLPDIISSTDPGDLFIVRNIGNVIPLAGGEVLTNAASTGAAIEFAVEVLNVRDIIVMGHGDCGAMKQLSYNEASGLPHLDSWLENARPAFHRYLVAQQAVTDAVEDASHDVLSKINVVLQLEHLTSYPSVQNRVKSGELKLHGWWFDLSKAKVTAYDFTEARFKPFNEVYAKALASPID